MPDDGVHGNHNLRVEIAGLGVVGCQVCSGVGSEIEVIECREGGWPGQLRKLPGLTRCRRILLRRAVDEDTAMHNWYELTSAGSVERHDGSIILLNGAGAEVARWDFYRARREHACTGDVSRK